MWSFESIASPVLQTATLLLTFVLYVFLVARLLPALLLKPRYAPLWEEEACDECIKKFVFDGGRAIVCRVAPRDNIVRSYVLIASGAEKSLRCCFQEDVYDAEVEILAFDGSGRLLSRIRAKQAFSRNGRFSDIVALPGETAYTKLILRSFNGIRLPCEDCFRMSRRGIVLFGLCVFTATLAEAYGCLGVLLTFKDMFFADLTLLRGLSDVLLVLSSAVLSWLLTVLSVGLNRPEKEKKKSDGFKAFSSAALAVLLVLGFSVLSLFTAYGSAQWAKRRAEAEATEGATGGSAGESTEASGSSAENGTAAFAVFDVSAEQAFFSL